MPSSCASWLLVSALTTYVFNVVHAPGIFHTFSQPNAAVVVDVCEGSFACSLTGTTWPNSKDFSCGDVTVSRISFLSARDSIISGAGTSTAEAPSTWPSSFASECQNSTNAERYEYTNGFWTAYYMMSTRCGCPQTGTTNLPNCMSATSQTSDACNVAMFTFCAMNHKGVACTY